MGRARAKRANRGNPREDRNVIPFSEIKSLQRKNILLIPRNASQEEYISALQNESVNIVFGVGPAGTGKTMLATLAAAKALESGQISKIVITRPNVAVDDNPIGHLPGDLIGKMTPWMLPILDVLKEVYSVKEVLDMMQDEVIEIAPVAFIRGRTFKDAWVIVDEAQGTRTGDTLKAIMTRIGEGSKMVITGDLEQSDFGKSNGLQYFLDRFQDAPSSRIKVINFKRRDVERHPVVREVLSIFNDS